VHGDGFPFSPSHVTCAVNLPHIARRYYRLPLVRYRSTRYSQCFHTLQTGANCWRC